MNILIVGCGSVGASLASILSRRGHDVSIVDRNQERFELLDNDYTGLTVSGVPIDQDVLKRAGIQGCDALVACSSDDNMNLMVSQMAKELFGVKKVLARVYDPRREEVFTSFGLPTICPTNLTVDSVVSILTNRQEVQHLTWGSSTLSFATIDVPKQYNGDKVRSIPLAGGECLIGVLHESGQTTLVANVSDYTVYSTDKLIVAKVVD